MSKQSAAPTSAPNSSIDSSADQARHRKIARASVTESRAPHQLLKDSQVAALAGSTNGALPGDK